ncbi:MAG TPA: hypothetical protein PKA64_19620 [Myxococcota bacterium]|nr:hypothetical protein [Myxococcota bacterium]
MFFRLVRGCLLMSAAAWIGACAVPVRAIGVIRPTAEGATVTSTEGRSRELILDGDAEPMRWLNGHTAEVEGRTHGRAIRVDRWHVTEGLNGLPVWVGRLAARPGGLMLVELDGGAAFGLDDDASEQLAPWIGRIVLVEGYVESTLGIHVMFFRPLFDEGGAAGP